MSKKVIVNNYIPTYLPKDFPLYERDGLMTYIDRLKYEKLEPDGNKHFKHVELLNFALIHHCCRGDPLSNSENF